jgi:hypothetical protein
MEATSDIEQLFEQIQQRELQLEVMTESTVAKNTISVD